MELKGILLLLSFKHNLPSFTVNLCIYSFSFLACYSIDSKSLIFFLVASYIAIYQMSCWDQSKGLPVPLPRLLPYCKHLIRSPGPYPFFFFFLMHCWQTVHLMLFSWKLACLFIVMEKGTSYKILVSRRFLFLFCFTVNLTQIFFFFFFFLFRVSENDWNIMLQNSVLLLSLFPS